MKASRAGARVLAWLTRLLHRPTEDSRPQCPLCTQGEAHQVFITSPPGWGSVMGCSAATRPHGVIVGTPEDIARLRAERIPR